MTSQSLQCSLWIHCVQDSLQELALVGKHLGLIGMSLCLVSMGGFLICQDCSLVSMGLLLRSMCFCLISMRLLLVVDDLLEQKTHGNQAKTHAAWFPWVF